jgi:hypothetical protein
LTSERYRVVAEPEVGDDLRELAAVDEELVRAALALMLELRADPWLGESLFERYNLRPLEGCRKIRFDVPGWQSKPRYRLVYRNEPDDGAPGLVRVWSVGARAKLVAYTRGAARLARAQAATRRRRP